MMNAARQAPKVLNLNVRLCMCVCVCAFVSVRQSVCVWPMFLCAQTIYINSCK